MNRVTGDEINSRNPYLCLQAQEECVGGIGKTKKRAICNKLRSLQIGAERNPGSTSNLGIDG